MNLNLPIQLADRYKSKSQIARIVTEAWVKNNLLCPSCSSALMVCPPNTKTKDFDCIQCGESFQLKSYAIKPGTKILGGEYATELASINSGRHPSIILLHYDNNRMIVLDIQIIHRLFITTSCVIPRKPLSSTARRKNWQGFMLDLSQIPSNAQISIVNDSLPRQQSEISQLWKKMQTVNQIRPEFRGWLADIMLVVEKMNSEFSLEEMYKFEDLLKAKHPANQNIQPKIRQQLQILRNLNFLVFLGRGFYHKL